MKIAYVIDSVSKSEKVKQANLFAYPHNEIYNFPQLKNYDSIVLLPEEHSLSESYLNLITPYIKEDAVMLPLVILKTEKATGILNSCVWNMNIANEPGYLDHDLAIKQIDLTLYGALIPTKHLIEENFNKDIKYYQHFYFLNKVTKNNIEVVGVPKTLLSTSIDLSYSDIPNEEKIKYFNMAKEV